MKAALLGGGGGGRWFMSLTLCPWIRKCINTWSYSYPVKHNSQNSHDGSWMFCSLQGNRRKEKPKCSLWYQILSWASCRPVVSSLVLVLSFLAGWTSELLCHCQCVYPWAVSAPLFSQSLGKQDMLAWGGHCSACLAVTAALDSPSCAGELSPKPPWHEDHKLYFYLSWSWEALLLIRCSEMDVWSIL